MGHKIIRCRFSPLIGLPGGRLETAWVGEGVSGTVLIEIDV